jgi:hypothetical protein
MEAILFKLNKSEKQQELIDRWIMSEYTSKLLVAPIIGSKNISVTQFDEMGRDFVYTIDVNGSIVR